MKVHTIKWSELTKAQRDQLDSIAAAGGLKTKEDILKALVSVGAVRG